MNDRKTYNVIIVYDSDSSIKSDFCAFTDNKYLYLRYIEMYKVLLNNYDCHEFIFDGLTEKELLIELSSIDKCLGLENEIESNDTEILNKPIYSTDKFKEEVEIAMTDDCSYNGNYCCIWIIEPIIDACSLFVLFNGFINPENDFMRKIVKLLGVLVKKYIPLLFVLYNDISDMDLWDLTDNEIEKIDNVLKINKSISTIEIYDVIDYVYLIFKYCNMVYGYPDI